MAFGVTVDFNANVAKFSGQVDKISGDLSRFSKTTESAFSLAKTAVVGFAGAFGAVQLTQFVRSGIDTADMLGKLSDRTGVAVEQLAGLKLAADLSDTSIEEVGRAINKLSIFMGQNAEAAKQLGISAKDPIDAFLQFADIFSSITDDQQRAAVGNKVLGKSYANLAPLLRQGSDALREQIRQGREFLPVTKDMAKASANFNDNLAKLSASTSQYAIVLGGPIVSAFNDLIEKLQFATRDAVTLNNVLNGIGDSWFNRESLGLTRGLTELNEKIAAQKDKISALKNEGGIGGLIDGLLVYDIGEERRKLDLLLRQRDQMIADISKRRSKSDEGSSPAPTQSDVNKFLTGSRSVGKSTGSVQSARSRDEGAAVIDNLGRQIALYDETSNVAKLRYEIERGNLTKINAAQKEKILGMGEELDRLDALKSEYEEFDDIVKTGQDLAHRQRQRNEQEALREQDLLLSVRNDLASNESDDFTALENYWEQRREIVRDAATLEAIEKNELMLEIDRQYQQQRQQLVLTTTSQTLGNISQGFDAMTQLAQEYYGKQSKQAKAAFELQKAIAVAQTIIQTYQGAQQAFTSLSSIPYVGPVLGAIAAAAAVAAGLARISAIRSQQLPAAHGGLDYVPKEQTYLLDRGERVLSPRQNEDLTKFLRGSVAQSGNSVTINISAPDGRVDPRSLTQIQASVSRGLRLAEIRNS